MVSTFYHYGHHKITEKQCKDQYWVIRSINKLLYDVILVISISINDNTCRRLLIENREPGYKNTSID